MLVLPVVVVGSVSVEVAGDVVNGVDDGTDQGVEDGMDVEGDVVDGSLVVVNFSPVLSQKCEIQITTSLCGCIFKTAS